MSAMATWEAPGEDSTKGALKVPGLAASLKNTDSDPSSKLAETISGR